MFGRKELNKHLLTIEIGQNIMKRKIDEMMHLVDTLIKTVDSMIDKTDNRLAEFDEEFEAIKKQVFHFGTRNEYLLSEIKDLLEDGDED